MKCIIFFCSTKISKYSYEYGINPEHNNSWGYNETVKLIEIVFFNRQTIKKLMDSKTVFNKCLFYGSWHNENKYETKKINHIILKILFNGVLFYIY